MRLVNYYDTDLSGIRIKQNRSKKTYDALIKTGFKLLKTREYDSITVSELSKSAGYSVGAFYTRFRSKDEFFDALVVHHFKIRYANLERLFSTLYSHDFADVLIEDIVYYYRTNHRFWRAALIRSIRDPEFWSPFKKSGQNLAGIFISRLSELASRPLADSEKTNVYFAFQMVFGIINNTIINEPGPITMEQKLFSEKLTRAFRLMTDYDNILKGKPSGKHNR